MQRKEQAEPAAHRLSVTTRPLSDVTNLLHRLPNDGPLAWVRNGEGLVAWGQVARLQVSGRERFSRTQRWWTNLLSTMVIDDTVSVPGTGPVAFGSFAFDDELGTSIVVVPKVVIGRKAGQSWITTIGQVPTSDLTPVVAVPTDPGIARWSGGKLTGPQWESAVAAAIARITAGEVDKVVLARDECADFDVEIDPRYVLQRLANAYPSCWTFSVDGLIGATPELLVRRIGDLVTSRVLAGTVSTHGDARQDARAATQLLDSGKDLEEHAFAVRSVARALGAHCTDLDVPDEPRVLKLANVQHLATDVTGLLADGASVLSLAASLHPTAAVCGTPTERAFTVIRELEGMDRERYAGPVGWFDAHGDGEFGIALRSAMIEGSHLRAFAGCGIVAGSVPAMEFAESSAKLIPIKSALEHHSV